MKSRYLLAIFAILAQPFAATALRAEDKVDFEKTILPIFEEKCMDCHRAAYTTPEGRTKKPKGDLRMDDAKLFAEGGESGKAFEAGKPDESKLVELILLTAEDDDVMPPKDGPLPKEEIDAIKKWIAEGASFGNWTETKFDDEGKPIKAAADAEKAEEKKAE